MPSHKHLIHQCACRAKARGTKKQLEQKHNTLLSRGWKHISGDEYICRGCVAERKSIQEQNKEHVATENYRAMSQGY